MSYRVLEEAMQKVKDLCNNDYVSMWHDKSTDRFLE